MSYKSRLEKHEKKKLQAETLKPSFSSIYVEPTDEFYLLVSWGYGDPHSVAMAAHAFNLNYCDVLLLVDNDITEKNIEYGEERAGFIGRPTFRQIQYTSWFLFKNKDLQEEVAILFEEEKENEIETIFGGGK